VPAVLVAPPNARERCARPSWPTSGTGGSRFRLPAPIRLSRKRTFTGTAAVSRAGSLAAPPAPSGPRRTRGVPSLSQELLHALQPILEGSPLKLATWATMMSAISPCTSSGISRALDTLIDLDLVRREGSGHSPVLRLLRENGEGKRWVKAGSTSEAGPGYFVVPHEYWTTGLYRKLHMPGKAMFLITLAETQNPKTPAFHMAYERAMDWYGVSDGAVRRYMEDQGLLRCLADREPLPDWTIGSAGRC
jgi:hypothetical protein